MLVEFIIGMIIFLYLLVVGVIGAVVYFVCQDEEGIDWKRLFWLMVFCGPVCWFSIVFIKGMDYLDANSYRIMRYLRNEK